MPADGGPAQSGPLASGPNGDATLLARVSRIGDAYGLVLLLILATFVVTMTLAATGPGGRVAAVLAAGLTAVVAFTSSGVSPGRMRLGAALAAGAAVSAVVAEAVSSDALQGAAFIVDALLLAAAAITILRRVVLATEVDFRTILGAVSVYTLLGLLYAYAFIAISRVHNGTVFAGVAHASAQDSLFFSYTTLTTTGYGNLVPQGEVAQILAVFEMLTGQVFLVTLVARLVTLWRPVARASADRGGTEGRS